MFSVTLLSLAQVHPLEGRIMAACQGYDLSGIEFRSLQLLAALLARLQCWSSCCLLMDENIWPKSWCSMPATADLMVLQACHALFGQNATADESAPGRFPTKEPV